MLNLSRILEEARNSSVTYPNVYRTNKVWKIREDNHSPWGRPMNSYLLASFVLKNHLRVLELGFNVRSNSITGDRTLMFLTKEDAESFLTFLKRNYVSDIDWNGYIIAGGRCDEDMVRITSDEFGIPVYVYKRSIEYLLKFKDSDLKIPSYVVDRLSDQAIVSKEQQDKEFKKQTLKGKVDEQNERLFNILKSIDPNLNCNRGGNNNSIGYIIINRQFDGAICRGYQSVQIPDEAHRAEDVNENKRYKYIRFVFIFEFHKYYYKPNRKKVN